MPLELHQRFYGNSIYVIRCSGAIVTGDSLTQLEAAFREGLLKVNRFVLDLREVYRIDSTGMGLLVRFLSQARSAGGDVRLASPSGFVRKLLSATRLDTVFLVYTSEYNAIASFFVRAAPGEKAREFVATVLFVDQSQDLCAFARTVLQQHGYEVLTTDCFSEAQLLAQAAQPSVVLIGPKGSALTSEAIVPAMQAAAPNAVAISLSRDFSQSDPHHATSALLAAVKQGKAAQA